MTQSEEFQQQYQQWKAGNGFCRETGLSVISMTGKDRAAFLHNFCTADIKAMVPGDSREAFVLNAKGKTLGFIQVLSNEDQLLVLISNADAEAIHQHLSRFVIVEDVEITRSNDTVFLLSFSIEGSFPFGISSNSSVYVSNSADQTSSELLAKQHVECPPEVLETIRIENKFPLSGVDVTIDNLAQEFDRTELAISFKKGCYLGQETVARLDALGHTNKELVRIQFEPEAKIAIGNELTVDDKKVGKLSSVCHSPEFQSPLGLAIVKKPHHKPGSKVQIDSVTGVVIP